MDLAKLLQEHTICAELPYLNARQLRLLELHHRDNLMNLADELYLMAKEDEKAFESGEKAQEDFDQRTGMNGRQQIEATAENIGGLKAAKAMVADEDTTRIASDLLHTIHPTVLEAIISNTFGYKYVTDEKFKDYLYKTDGCAGVYLLTVYIVGDAADKGKGLTRIEWEAMKLMLEKYKYDEDIEQAADIDMIYRCRGDKRRDVRDEIRKMGGNLKFQGLENVCEQLSARISTVLDTDGDIRQMQMPVVVGCSQSLQRRLPQHDPDDREALRNSTDSWVLFLSCLKVMGIRFKTVRVPVLKIWEADQLKIAEILLTMLAGSMIYSGGLNMACPGGQGLKENPSNVNILRQAEIEIFLRNNWATENLEKTKTMLDERRLDLKYLEKLENDSWDLDKRYNELETDYATLEKQALKISEEVKQELINVDSFCSPTQCNSHLPPCVSPLVPGSINYPIQLR